jgi:hypothetical protein
MLRSIILAAALTALAAALTVIPSEAKMQIQVVDALIKVLPDGDNPRASGGEVFIEAARGEYESAQIVVTSDEEGSLQVNGPSFSGPSGRHPAAQVRFVGYVPIVRGTGHTPDHLLVAKPPAEIPDPLLEDRSITLRAGRRQSVWLTVRVPQECAPGEYRGCVRLTGPSGEAEVPVRVRVRGVTVPEERTLFVTNWFNVENIASAGGVQPWSEGHWKLLEAWARLMAEHRQNVVLTPVLSLIVGREDTDGRLSFDFSRLDRWIRLFERAGVLGLIEGGHLGGRSEWEAPDFDAARPATLLPDGSLKQWEPVKATSAAQREFLSRFLPALRDHLREIGWLDRYVQHLVDEPITVNAESYNRLAAMVREFAPELRIIEATLCREVAGSVDIWVPQPQEIAAHADFFQERRAKGEQVWFYTCLSPTSGYMNRMIDYHLLPVRLLHWQNFRYGLPGYLHWGLNFWRDEPFRNVEPLLFGETYLPPGDSHITYPGKYGPLSSIRLEAMRDGIEDYELLRLLAKRDRKAAEEICSSVVRSMTDYTLDPAEFRKARKRLLDELERRQ